MGYMEITTIVEGALEGSLCFEGVPGIKKMTNHILSTQSFARDNSDMTVQMYELWHEHEQGIECECIQFVQDHKPFWEQIGKNA